MINPVSEISYCLLFFDLGYETIKNAQNLEVTRWDTLIQNTVEATVCFRIIILLYTGYITPCVSRTASHTHIL